MRKIVDGSRTFILVAESLVSVALMAFSCGYSSTSAAAAEERTTQLHFLEPKPSAKFAEEVLDAFKKAHFARLKYAPSGTLEGAVDPHNVKAKWAYSVTQNCSGPCSNTSSTIPKRIVTARRVDGECPRPYELALELLDSNENVIETFAFSLGGVCFNFRGRFYAVAPSASVGQELEEVPFEKIFLLK